MTEKQLVKGFTNEELWDKAEYEGTEYFFLNYNTSNILDTDLKKAVEQFQNSYHIIEAILSQYEPEEY